jgi:hypothetical protein
MRTTKGESEAQQSFSPLFGFPFSFGGRRRKKERNKQTNPRDYSAWSAI